MCIQEYLSSILFINASDFFDSIHDREYAYIKGEALSIQAYKKPGQRNVSDIDILLPRNELQYFETKLKQNGFVSSVPSRLNRIVLLSSSHQVAPWVRYIEHLGPMYIDLNFDIFWGEYDGKRADMNLFLCDTKELEIFGCKVKTLSTIKAMIQLVLHHYKDLNSIILLASRKKINPSIFKDIYYFVKNNQEEITVEKLYTAGLEYEILPFIYYMLYYTRMIYKDKILDEYIANFRTPEGEELLQYYGLNKSEWHKWKVDFYTRLNSENIYNIIKEDLTERDREKILFNKKVFIGD